MKLNEFLAKNGDREIVDIEALEKCLAPKSRTIWDIKFGETYYLLNIDGEIAECTWDNHSEDISMRAMGMAFLTREEAEVRKKMLLIEAELIRLGGRREFKVNSENWNMIYDPVGELITVQSYRYYTLNDIYFDNRMDLLEAILEIGYSRMIREYFKPRIIEVKENGRSA